MPSIYLLDSIVTDPAAVTGVLLAAFSAIYTYKTYIWGRKVKSENDQLQIKTRELNELNPHLEVLENYTEVWSKMKVILGEEIKGGSRVVIRNIGLDLEKALPDLYHFVRDELSGISQLNLNYCGLIIDPDASLIKPMIDDNSNIRTEFVTASYTWLKVLKDEFSHRDFQLEVRRYHLPPLMHGIMINNQHLFLGFTEIERGKLHGSNNPYIYMKKDNQVRATQHYFNFYNNWFDYYWNYGK